jgi:hypothetical protein
MLRTFLAALTLLALLLVPVVAAGAAQQEGTGTAQSALRLGSLAIDGLPAALPAVDLGSLDTLASTEDDTVRNALGGGLPFAQARVNLPVAGATTARSDSTTTQPGRTVALAGGLGSVTAGRLDATVVDGTARASVDALRVELVGLAGGPALGTPGAGAVSLVDATHARAVNGASLDGLALDLTDVIPRELLEQLPLSVLLDLAGELPIDLGDLGGRLQDLIDRLALVDATQTAITQVNAQIAAAEAELAAATAQLAPLEAAIAAAAAQLEAATGAQTAAQAAVADANAGLTTAQADLAGITAQIGSSTCELLGLCEQLAAAQAAVAAAQSAADTANAQLATATQTVTTATAALAAATTSATPVRDSVSALTTTLTSLTNQLATLVRDLDRLLREVVAILPTIGAADLNLLVGDLLDGLTDLQLLAIDRVVVGVTSTATSENSEATATCQVSGVALLGLARQVGSCTELRDVLGQLDAVLTELLADLPIVADVTGRRLTAADVTPAALRDVVRVGGLTTTASPPGTRAGDRFFATSAVSALTVEVLPLELTQVTDDLLATVTGLIDGALAQLGDLTGLDTALVTQVTGQLTGLVTDLTAVLPAGDLAGALTPGLDVDVLGLTSASSFQAAQVADPSPTTPGTPTTLILTPGGGTPATGTPTTGTPTTGTPTTGSPSPVVPARTLPRTGGGMPGASLLLLGAGGALAAAASRRRPG